VRGRAEGKVMRENEPVLLVLPVFEVKLFLRKGKFYLRNVSIRTEMFFLTPLAFAYQFVQELIKLIKGLVCQILRQLKEISDQECIPPL
jgi:hypothetical protein